jgi:hypothetical protein
MMKSFKLTIALLVILGLVILAMAANRPLTRLAHTVFTPSRTIMVGTSPVHLDDSFNIERKIKGGPNDELHLIAAAYRDMRVVICSIPAEGDLNFEDYLDMVFLKQYRYDIDKSTRFNFEYAGDTAYCYRAIEKTVPIGLSLSRLIENREDSITTIEDHIFIPDKHIYYCITGEDITENDAIDIVKRTLYPHETASPIMLE